MKAYFGEVDLNFLELPVIDGYPGKFNEQGRQYFLNTVNSAKGVGVLKPIIVRENVVMIGGARVRAAKYLGFITLPAIIFSKSPKPTLHKIKSYDELLKKSRLSRLIVTDKIVVHK